MKNQIAVPEAKFFNRAELLENLLQISIALSASRDRREMLEMILTEARRLTNAQAGTLYIKHQDQLQFVVAQNDVIDLSTINNKLIGRSIKIANNSLAGFAALTGRIVNIPDSHHLASGAPFRINRDLDQTTGYDTRSILAIPLKCPDGEVVGVLQLINCLGHDGAIVPFQLHQDQPIMSLASMAAVSIHNLLLTERLKRANLDTIIRLSVIAEFRDRGTAQHIKRISHISTLIARAMKLDDEQVELIQSASPMHDIGKIGIPDSILLKPGPLTDEERKIVEKHTIIGGEILANPTNDLMITAR
ncbi:MAG: GAF domain-containing protein, partial [Planctomycetes bacterium]|nr:GAF domain-containing protein [Planctomycetota bacterium]